MIGDFYRVDLYLPEYNMVIEVNGPPHFNGLGIYNKKTLLKQRVIEKLGYKYLSITTMEF